MSSMIKKAGIFTRLSLGLLLSGVLAHAGIIYSDLGAGNSYDSTTGYAAWGSAFIAGYYETGASFTASTADTVAQIDIALGSVPGGLDDDNVVISLDSDISGVPGSALESWSINGLAAFGSTSDIVETLLTASPVSLLSGDQYWVVISPADSHTVVGWNLSDPNGASGTTTYKNSGSGWISQAGNSVAFDVLDTITATPEPGAVVLMACGLAGVALRTRRREA